MTYGEAGEKDASLWLGAPEDGGPIYEKHGFVRDGRQMKLELDGE